MNEYRQLCEIGWELEEIIRKRRDAQARTRAYTTDQAGAKDPEARQRAQGLADRWAKKSGELLKREEELSGMYQQLDAELRRLWKKSR